VSQHPYEQDLAEVDAVLHRVSTTLAEKFRGVFNAETIDRYVNESYVALYRTAASNRHVPALAERFATDRLTALAQAKGVINKTVPEVLFLCRHNAGRSQLAAALLAHHGAGRVHVRSAGSQPATVLEEHVAAVLAEVGVPLGEAYPKPLTDDVLRAADVIVTMGCGEACPVVPGTRYLDWDLPDPAGQPLDAVRAVRDDLTTRVQALLAELTPDTSDAKDPRP
jgi:protein-tyrosine-phosphatase